MKDIKIIKEAYDVFIEKINEFESNETINDKDLEILIFNNKKKDKVIAILYYITNYISENFGDYFNKGILINRNWFKDYFKLKNNQYASVLLRFLTSINIVYVFKEFSFNNHKSRFYKFNDNFNLNEFAIVDLELLSSKNLDCFYPLYERDSNDIHSLLEKKQLTYNPYCIYQAAMLDKLTLRDSYIENLRKILNISKISDTYKREDEAINYPLFNPIIRILTKNITCKKEQGMRLYSTFTSLPKKVRPFFRFNGNSMIEVDVSNCQLTMMAAIFRKLLPDYLITKDFLAFENACNIGSVYNDIAAKAGLKRLFKKKKGYFKGLFMQVWYGANKKYKIKNDDTENIIVERIRYAMKSLYPTMYACLQLAKGSISKSTIESAREYISRLPTALQNFESEIMLNYVSTKLIKDKINFLNLHDAIIVSNDSDADKVITYLQEAFRKILKTSVSFKKEPLIPKEEFKNLFYKKNDDQSQLDISLPDRMKNKKVKMDDEFYTNKDFSNSIHEFCNKYGRVKAANKRLADFRRDNNEDLWNALERNNLFTRTDKQKNEDKDAIDKAEAFVSAIKKIREKIK